MQYLFSKSEILELHGDTPHPRGTESTNANINSTFLVATRARPLSKGTAFEGRAAITVAILAVTWNGIRRTLVGKTKASAAVLKEVQILIFNRHVAQGSGCLCSRDKEGRCKDQEGKKENERSAHLENLFSVGVDDGIGAVVVCLLFVCLSFDFVRLRTDAFSFFASFAHHFVRYVLGVPRLLAPCTCIRLLASKLAT
jgi:hypothetical protein